MFYLSPSCKAFVRYPKHLKLFILQTSFGTKTDGSLFTGQANGENYFLFVRASAISLLSDADVIMLARLCSSQGTAESKVQLTSYRSWQVVSLLECVLDQIAWPLTVSMSAATANFPSGFFSTSVMFREMSNYISVYITGPTTKTGFILSYFLHISTSVVQ